MSIEIANESGVEVDTDAVLAVARHALDEMGVNPLAELSVLLVDIDYMSELNHRWMGGDGPTDVLAFPMDEGSVDHGPGESAPAGGEPALLGDIVLCPEVAAKQAATAGHSPPTSCTCSPCTGCCTCSATTTPSRRRSGRCSALQARLLASWRSTRPSDVHSWRPRSAPCRSSRPAAHRLRGGAGGAGRSASR